MIKTNKLLRIVVPAISYIVFALFDLLDMFLCLCHSFIDGLKEKNTNPCYCCKRKSVHGESNEDKLSETLYDRKNIFRDLGFPKLAKESEEEEGSAAGFLMVKNRWSDCNCESCLSWQKFEDHNLHSARENVIFLHGFVSSSHLWTENVFHNLSESGNQNCRLFAMDLLGFGKSPKPNNCLYTIKDHLEMVEKSVISQFELGSFHLVAHSMGCIIALGLASKYQKSVKSLTLIAPPYFPASSKGQASLNALNMIAERKLWPPLSFCSSIMSGYEHLGRSICFVVCKHHRTWEWLLKLITRRRELPCMLLDLTKHTHHSAWHTMHNVLCGGAKLMDGYIEAVSSSEIMLTVFQGDKDGVVPVECSHNIKLKVPSAEIRIIPNANHSSLILNRKEVFTRELEHIWFSSAEKYNQEDTK
ncbi:hypothetical protein MKW98_011440 [Papaver atlanticum]|uniref:AB hydrolase-1 domain-containing protein n=1 Tax=Papaver atlanticum TaxID=357466 RepID=A0AAD4TC85_9MAGN|nr:hypothetical protein MKW98_011440 [Papaver atlanticum]